jgi:hypothetical protein
MNTWFFGKVKKKIHKNLESPPKRAIFFIKLRKIIKFYIKNYKGCKTPQQGI